MRLVGATNWRIRVPFLIEGLVESLVGATLAIIGLFLVKVLVIDQLRGKVAFLPLIVVICNDGSYGAEYDQFVNKGVRPDLSLFQWPDFAEVARSLGAEGLTIESVSDVAAAVAACDSPTRPVVIDVRTTPGDIPEVPHL